jgi:hypothetical protein
MRIYCKVIMQLKKKLREKVQRNPRVAVAGVGMIVSAGLFVALGAIDASMAQAFEVCGGDNIGGDLQDQLRRLTTALVVGALLVGFILGMVDHLETLRGSGGDKLWESDAMRGAVSLVLGMYIVDFALSLIFQVNVTCILPWGG